MFQLNLIVPLQLFLSVTPLKIDLHLDLACMSNNGSFFSFFIIYWLAFGLVEHHLLLLLGRQFLLLSLYSD